MNRDVQIIHSSLIVYPVVNEGFHDGLLPIRSFRTAAAWDVLLAALASLRGRGGARRRDAEDALQRHE